MAARRAQVALRCGLVRLRRLTCPYSSFKVRGPYAPSRLLSGVSEGKVDPDVEAVGGEVASSTSTRSENVAMMQQTHGARSEVERQKKQETEIVTATLKSCRKLEFGKALGGLEWLLEVSGEETAVTWSLRVLFSIVFEQHKDQHKDQFWDLIRVPPPSGSLEGVELNNARNVWSHAFVSLSGRSKAFRRIHAMRKTFNFYNAIKRIDRTLPIDERFPKLIDTFAVITHVREYRGAFIQHMLRNPPDQLPLWASEILTMLLHCCDLGHQATSDEISFSGMRQAYFFGGIVRRAYMFKYIEPLDIKVQTKEACPWANKFAVETLVTWKRYRKAESFLRALSASDVVSDRDMEEYLKVCEDTVRANPLDTKAAGTGADQLLANFRSLHTFIDTYKTTNIANKSPRVQQTTERNPDEQKEENGDFESMCSMTVALGSFNGMLRLHSAFVGLAPSKKELFLTNFADAIGQVSSDYKNSLEPKQRLKALDILWTTVSSSLEPESGCPATDAAKVCRIYIDAAATLPSESAAERAGKLVQSISFAASEREGLEREGLVGEQEMQNALARAYLVRDAGSSDLRQVVETVPLESFYINALSLLKDLLSRAGLGKGGKRARADVCRKIKSLIHAFVQLERGVKQRDPAIYSALTRQLWLFLDWERTNTTGLYNASRQQKTEMAASLWSIFLDSNENVEEAKQLELAFYQDLICALSCTASPSSCKDMVSSVCETVTARGLSLDASNDATMDALAELFWANVSLPDATVLRALSPEGVRSIYSKAFLRFRSVADLPKVKLWTNGFMQRLQGDQKDQATFVTLSAELLRLLTHTPSLTPDAKDEVFHMQWDLFLQGLDSKIPGLPNQSLCNDVCRSVAVSRVGTREHMQRVVGVFEEHGLARSEKTYNALLRFDLRTTGDIEPILKEMKDNGFGIGPKSVEDIVNVYLEEGNIEEADNIATKWAAKLPESAIMRVLEKHIENDKTFRACSFVSQVIVRRSRRSLPNLGCKMFTSVFIALQKRPYMRLLDSMHRQLLADDLFQWSPELVAVVCRAFMALDQTHFVFGWVHTKSILRIAKRKRVLTSDILAEVVTFYGSRKERHVLMELMTEYSDQMADIRDRISRSSKAKNRFRR
mmetsp:Transcript_6933/g.12762  ORF Transcript_6933/g.12762 Transcript_6933/m.12762 type:complete len:1123 (-) Transcript_6933:168-3536(-)